MFELSRRKSRKHKSKLSLPKDLFSEINLKQRSGGGQGLVNSKSMAAPPPDSIEDITDEDIVDAAISEVAQEMKQGRDETLDLTLSLLVTFSLT